MEKVRSLFWIAVVAVFWTFMFWLAASAAYSSPEGVCDELDSGKVDIENDYTYSVLVVAPEGYLIEGYCVKAGSINQGEGPVYVTVDPPARAVNIMYPTGRAISHYSVAYTVNENDVGVWAECTAFEDGSRLVKWAIRNYSPTMTFTITEQVPDSGIRSVPPGTILFWEEGYRHDDPRLGASWSMLGTYPDSTTLSRGDSVRFDPNCMYTPTTTTTAPPTTTTTVPEASTTTTSPTDTTMPEQSTTTVVTSTSIPTPTPPPSLPFTGVDLVPALILAVGLSALGTGLLRATRRK